MSAVRKKKIHIIWIIENLSRRLLLVRCENSSESVSFSAVNIMNEVCTETTMLG